jgi:DNA-binding NarL/FixJ family response regulator
MEYIKIAIVDDHKMLSAAIEKMISVNLKYKVISNSGNGEEFIESLENSELIPDVVLMDVNMPVKNGLETTQHLKDNFPDI